MPSNSKACRGEFSSIRRKSHRTTSSSASPSAHVATSLHYRNGDEDSVVVRHATSSRITASNGGSDSDKSVSARSNFFFIRRKVQNSKDHDNEQFGLDEYLSFLDRRYSRLYGEEERREPRSINTTMNWLMKGSPLSKEDAARQQEHAHHILGMAAQASMELLSKEQPKKTTPSSVVVDTSASIIPNLEPDTRKSDVAAPQLVRFVPKPFPSVVGSLASMMKTRLSAGVGIFRRIREQRNALFVTQTPQIFMKLIRDSAMTVPVMARNAVLATISIAGGKANVRLAITVAASLLIILRPIGSATLQG
mmetsp:Transcript_6943/g.10248  ORF Transcript_6943/g.10248 Transcript_6943/m.10248 type:complete len:307 (-) Transcript_6943:197-1117(-)